MSTLNVKDFPDSLYRAIQNIARRESRSISQQVIHMLREATKTPRRLSITELRGLGKEVWNGEEPERFVDKERDGWD